MRALERFFSKTATVERVSDGSGMISKLSKATLFATGLLVLSATFANAQTSIPSTDPVSIVRQDIASMGMQNRVEIYERLQASTLPPIVQVVSMNDRFSTTPQNDDAYICAVILAPLRVEGQALALFSGKPLDSVPAIDEKIANRFVALNETSRCFAGRSIADFGVNAIEMHADAYAFLREIQLGTSKKDLENIRDARLASLVNSFAVTYDTSDVLTDILDRYDDLKSDAEFMSLDAAGVSARSEKFARNKFMSEKNFKDTFDFKSVAETVYRTKRMPVEFAPSEIAELKAVSEKWRAAFDANDRLNDAAKAEAHANLAGENGIENVPTVNVDDWFSNNSRQTNLVKPASKI